MAGKTFASATKGFMSTAQQEIKTAAEELENPAPVQQKKLGDLPAKKLRQRRVQAVLTNDMFAKVQQTADEYGISISETINQILKKFYS